jgi:hypothetical protein
MCVGSLDHLDNVTFRVFTLINMHVDKQYKLWYIFLTKQAHWLHRQSFKNSMTSM